MDKNQNKQTELANITTNNIRQSDWYYMQRMIERLQEDLKKEKILLISVSSAWLFGYDMLQAYFEAIIIHNPMQNEIDFYNKSLTSITQTGEQILKILKEKHFHQAIKENLGLSISDFQAMVEELSYANSNAYSDATSEQKKALETAFQK